MRAATLLLVLLSASACAPDLRAELAAAGAYSPRHVVIGDDALVDLGQTLFFDRELSGNRNIACATCHLPLLHATDARHLSVGQDGARLSRASLELFNRNEASALFWDGRVELKSGRIVAPVALPDGIRTLLEAQALLPLLDRHEMRGALSDIASDGRPNELAALADDAPEPVWAAIVARIVALDGYRPLFAAAFPDVRFEDVTIVHVARAIAAFEQRLWELTDTPFDDYLGSVSVPPKDDALNDVERRGAELFFGEAGCASCHGGPLLSDGAYHAIGVPQLGPGRDELHRDLGRFAVTGDPRDRFAFRTPPLRNVALTAPYMHDGAYDDLTEAVRHHLDPAGALARYDGAHLPSDLASQVHHELDADLAAAIDPATAPPRPLSEEEVAAIVVFLGALTARTELTLPASAGAPRSVPSGLPVEQPTFVGDVLPR